MIEDKFIQGFACAIACIIRSYDESSVALGILNENGFVLDDLKKAKVDNYDYKVIKEAMRKLT